MTLDAPVLRPAQPALFQAGTQAAASDTDTDSNSTVRHFRQIVLWPLQIMRDTHQDPRPEKLLQSLAPGRWQPVADEFGPGEVLHERHYREFVSFLPHVQRFLYGEANADGTSAGASSDAPMQTFRRNDVAAVAITLQPGATPVVCNIAHIDLHFFNDVDAVVLACEIETSNLPLAAAKEIMYRFGRAYPPGWSSSGEPLHCPERVAWLGHDGTVLSQSDYADRTAYLAFVGTHRSPRIAQHWEFILAPFLSHAAAPASPLRFRQIEYYRMPAMTYLVMDDLDGLTRADYMRLAFATGPGIKDQTPYSQQTLHDFEVRHCYDRFFNAAEKRATSSTRFLTCGHAFTIVAGGRDPWLLDPERGLLGQFRHQYFLLFLICHFHKASMLMLKDRLVATITRLEAGNPRSVATFRRDVYRLQESFMRFTQRYWFTDVSDQVQARDLYRMQIAHLGNDTVYRDLRRELFDTVQYLDSDMLRRQSGSMHRLTTVTILGLIGTTVTGFLGMNLFAEADASIATKLMYFMLVSAGTLALTVTTLALSGKLTRFFDKLSGEGS